MNNEKTIKQLADELGVSKTAINKKINENFKRKHFKKNGNKFLIDESGQNAIKSMFTDSSSFNRKPKVSENDNFENQDVSEVSDLVVVLKERLLISDEQNNKKDIQIEKLQKLLDQQQILTLQANKKIEELELKNDEQTEKEESVSSQNHEGKEAQTKKSFWSKFFGN